MIFLSFLVSSFMSLELLLLLFLVAIIAGWVDTLAGGGGLITTPALLFCGLSPASALATNKLQSSAGTLTATLYFIKQGTINISQTKLMILLTLAGSICGSYLVLSINPKSLMIVLPFLLVAVSLYTLFSKQMTDIDRRSKLSLVVFSIFIAPLIGLYDGFFGPGTGSFFTIAFVSLLGFGVTKATAHAKLLNLTSNIGALSYFLIAGEIAWAAGLIMMAGQFIGALVGAKMAIAKGKKLIKPVLIIACLSMSTVLIIKQI